MKNARQPAYPTEVSFHEGGMQEVYQTSDFTGIYPGLTKRELIAAMAMQGMLSASADRGEAYVAERSIAFADYLLKQLE